MTKKGMKMGNKQICSSLGPSSNTSWKRRERCVLLLYTLGWSLTGRFIMWGISGNKLGAITLSSLKEWNGNENNA